MIELTWSQIREPELNAALNKLIRAQVPYATALKLLTLVKGLEGEQKKAQEMFKIIWDKNMKAVKVKGKNGEMTETFKATNEKAMGKAMREHGETKCKFRLTKLDPSDLEEIKLSAVELAMLQPLIEVETPKEEKRLKAVPKQPEANA